VAETCARREGVSTIAAAMGGDKSTVSGEVAGHGRDGRYGAVAAQSRPDARHEARGPRRGLSDPAFSRPMRAGASSTTAGRPCGRAAGPASRAAGAASRASLPSSAR
jgi:hypothetical protein